MPETAANTEKTIVDGGFRIEIKPDELTVTADNKAWGKGKPTAPRYISLAGTLVLACVILMDWSTGPANNELISLTVFILLVAIGLLIHYFQGTSNIHCTRENLEVIRARPRRPAESRLFPRPQIQQIRFGAVAYGKYSAVMGIVFNVNGKKIKTLRGIEIPEAQTVLNELKRLGYDTLIDVGMPMAVEMALERRKSWL
ncbi:MAG TPA: hypothetical protein VF742_09565 [Terracidiphilus sp.]|jgi:hypothetical protein